MSVIVSPSGTTVAARLDQQILAILEDEYASLTSQLWWDRVAVRRTSQTKAERLHWLLSTARIERPNSGSQVPFRDLAALWTEFENEPAVAGLKLNKDQLEDLYNGIPGGEAMEVAAKWARDIAQYARYWPQEVVSDAIKGNPTAYDGKAFFAVDHPVNPYMPSAGAYANHFTGSASGVYPGAVPIHGPDLSVALANLIKVRNYIGSIKHPNGKSPRRLAMKGLLVPPTLYPRAVHLTEARFLSSATAGPNDVQALIGSLGLGQVIEAHELGANFSGSDTDYYVIAQEVGTSQLGAMLYVDREPFNITRTGGETDAQLARSREIEWVLHGRNTVAPGHPYMLFKCSAT